MNDILIKVQKYLDNVSKGPTQVDKKLVEEFGEACKNALLKQFTEGRRSKFEPRMSNIGRPLYSYKGSTGKFSTLCSLPCAVLPFLNDNKPYTSL